jgi:hypothetical protein
MTFSSSSFVTPFRDYGAAPHVLQSDRLHGFRISVSLVAIGVFLPTFANIRPSS